MPNEGASLNKNVAIRLMIGHMMLQMQTDIIYVINCGRSVGRITENVSFAAILPTTKSSNTNAIGIMIISSWVAAAKVIPRTTPVFSAILYTIIP